MPPQPRVASAFSSWTFAVTFGPRPFDTSFAAATTVAANSGGVKSPGGVFTQSRVAAAVSATTCASSKAWTNSFFRADGLSTTTSPGTCVGASSRCFLYVVNV